MPHTLRFACWLGLFMALSPVWGQRYTISGYVREAESGEQLISARVYDTRSQQGTLTNTYGFYSLTLPAGPVSLVMAYPGYQSFTLELNLRQDTVLNAGLAFFQTDEVQIVAEDAVRVEQQTEMSTIDIPVKQIKMLPALLGEVDVIKAVQLLPGVQSGNEGSTGLYVRGGGPDQNLILLDGVPLYYVSHLGGFFSVFNADAISSVKLVKGGFPARYGGRLSSVLDVRMKEGNNQRLTAEGSIGLLSSKLSIQGPIGASKKTSFILSGRRTYLDLLTRPLAQIASRAASDGNASASLGYYFYDLNGKVNHTFSHRDRLYFSFYLGDDDLGVRLREQDEDPAFDYAYDFSLRSKVRWGNRLAALRWNHIWNPKLFSNLTATFTDYRFRVENTLDENRREDGQTTSNSFFLGYRSGIRDWGLKLDFDYYPVPAHEIRFGINSTYHRFTPGALGINLEAQDIALLDTTIASQIANALETSLYFEDHIKAGRRLSANVGLHLAHYAVNQENYLSLQPRLSARYLVSEWVSLKASYVQMTQFLHLLTNSGAGLPVDLWVPATDRVPPQQAWQAALGMAATLGQSGLELSVEGYYKHMTGLLEYKEGTNFFLDLEDNWEERVEPGGEGTAYGMEVLLQKKKGRTTGWIGYTLSWNYRQFDNINQGLRYFYKYDRRHDVSVVVSHAFNDRISAAATWVFGTGNAITLPTATHAMVGPSSLDFFGREDQIGSFLNYNWPGDVFGSSGVLIYEGGRNNFRMADYHRLDLGINITKPTRRGERTWSLGVYNLYGRRNPYTYYLNTDYDPATGESRPVLQKFALFGFPIPYVSLNFRFDRLGRLNP